MAGKGNEEHLLFYVNGKKVEEKNVDPEIMLLTYLREKLMLTGTKYGCGGGGCGACTVMVSRYHARTKTITHISANACLLPVCQLNGAAVTTVEGIGNTKTQIHPVQERIAKAHGSQCGFCTPGMVMSMYTLLRNKPQPTLEDITEALGGNLCRCTGYRPIIEGYKTFCGAPDCCQMNSKGNDLKNGDDSEEGLKNDHPGMFNKEDLVPLDPTQDLIFPPELILMAEGHGQRMHTFTGERITWVSPVTLEELIKLKASHPKAPIVIGNTNIGLDIKFKGVLHPMIISPTRVAELFEVTRTPQGVCVGAGSSLSVVRALMEELVQELPRQQTEVFRALLQQLKNLGGQQIRNVASLGGNIVSAYPNSDLNPVLAAGKCILRVISQRGEREILLNKDFFVGYAKTTLKPDEVVLSILIPVSKQGEFVRAFRQAPRKENALATVTSGMRVKFFKGTSKVEDLSIYYGGVGPCIVEATKTCQEVIGRLWNEETMDHAYRLLLDDIALPPSAPGGKVEFRRSLTLSFLFKFNLKMRNQLQEMDVPVDYIAGEVSSALSPLPRELESCVQEFQEVSLSQPDQDPVGRPIMHRSAISHATGEAVYCDDIPRSQGELFLVLVTSTRAHAKIIKMDFSEAIKLPGVVDVVTARDIPGIRVCTFGTQPEELLAEKEVSCVGQVICAVAADTKQNAKRGAAAVKITYEDLPDTVFTVEEAIEKKSFFEPARTLERGCVTEAFATADHIHEGQVCLGGQEHFYMETQSVLVVPSGEEKEIKVFLSGQWPGLAQESIAKTLGIPSNRVSCHVKRVGGSFGGKISKAVTLANITSVAAWKTGHAVRLVLERGDDMLITGGRHPVLGKYKVGFMNNGRIIAADLQFYINAGHTEDESVMVVEKMLLHLDQAYNVPNLRGWAVACKTNLPSNTAFRGFGVPQTLLVIETMITDVAMLLGRTSEEIREINMYKGVSMTHYKQEFDPGNLVRCWEVCKEKSGYQSRRSAMAQFNQGSRWKKRGMAMVPTKFGVSYYESFFNQAAALVHVYKDGSVLVSHGGVEIGQGIHTKIQQIVSRELGVPVSLIYITETNTAAVPNALLTAASFSTDTNGMAVKDSCETLRRRLEPIVRENPSGTWESWIKQAFFKRISLSATGFYRGNDAYMDWVRNEGHPFAYFTFGTCFCEVEVDCLTGDYRNITTNIVFDIGRSINPSIDIGQIEGAFIQGMGLFTMEELEFSPSGVLYTRGPSQYKIPAVCDVPLSFNTYVLPGTKNPKAIYSSKGVGEAALPLASAVFFAIKDAVVAARREAGLSVLFSLDSPATPEKTCMACSSPFTQMIPVSKPGSYQPWSLKL